jgi:hypothetical protein
MGLGGSISKSRIRVAHRKRPPGEERTGVGMGAFAPSLLGSSLSYGAIIRLKCYFEGAENTAMHPNKQLGKTLFAASGTKM